MVTKQLNKNNGVFCSKVSLSETLTLHEFIVPFHANGSRAHIKAMEGGWESHLYEITLLD